MLCSLAYAAVIECEAYSFACTLTRVLLISVAITEGQENTVLITWATSKQARKIKNKFVLLHLFMAGGTEAALMEMDDAVKYLTFRCYQFYRIRRNSDNSWKLRVKSSCFFFSFCLVSSCLFLHHVYIKTKPKKNNNKKTQKKIPKSFASKGNVEIESAIQKLHNQDLGKKM